MGEETPTLEMPVTPFELRRLPSPVPLSVVVAAAKSATAQTHADHHVGNHLESADDSTVKAHQHTSVGRASAQSTDPTVTILATESTDSSATNTLPVVR